MTDRPILFSAPMVRALLDGRKTQTRRLFKPRGFEFYSHPISGDRYSQYRPYRDGTWDESRIVGDGPMQAFSWGEHLYGYMPFAPGDRLWVKETWRAHKSCDGQKPREILAGSRVWHEADRDNCDQHGKVRVAIFMPRWASRITLLVTDVRVERLQDCSEADAIAEGVKPIPFSNGPNFYSVDIEHGSLNAPTAAETYALLWHSINGPGAWEANPWVVAVTFEVVRGNIDQVPD